jgi:hypothetical protein
MALFGGLRNATSAAKLDAVEQAQARVKALAEELVTHVEEVEAPSRRATIAALSDSIRAEQAEIDAAVERAAKARSILAAAS